MCRGRFWALSELEDNGGGDEEAAEESAGGDGDAAAALSPDSDSSGLPGKATLGGFISRAEELGGSLWHGRRSAFAPRGRGSRLNAGGGSRFPRLGDAGWRQPGRARACSSPIPSRPLPMETLPGRGGGSPRARRGPSVAEGLETEPPSPPSQVCAWPAEPSELVGPSAHSWL
jgi:hypothetical protein